MKRPKHLAEPHTYSNLVQGSRPRASSGQHAQPVPIFSSSFLLSILANLKSHGLGLQHKAFPKELLTFKKSACTFVGICYKLTIPRGDTREPTWREMNRRLERSELGLLDDDDIPTNGDRERCSPPPPRQNGALPLPNYFRTYPSARLIPT